MTETPLKPTPSSAFGGLLGLLGFSAIAGILVAAMFAPAIAVTSKATMGVLNVFDRLPEYVTLGHQSQRTILYGLRAGQQVPFAQIYDQNRQEVGWDAISDFAKDALVAAEDVRFYQHGGVDLAGIARATVNNLAGKKLQGASSIEQQLVKQLAIQEAVATIKDPKKLNAAKAAAQATTLDRKLKEAKLAVGLEKRYSKHQILLAYLNIAGFGGNTYGIEAAAQQYYSTTAKSLTLAQAASLIAIVQQPNLRAPASPDNWERDQSRRDAILGTMFNESMISKKQFDEAIAVPVNASTVKLSAAMNGCSYATAAKPFCDYVVNSVKDLTGFGETPADRKAAWERGGYSVYTTIDLDQQAVAEADLAARTPASETRFSLGSAVSTVQVGTGRIITMAQNKAFDDTGEADPAVSTAINFNSDKGYGGSSGFPTGSTYKLFTLVNWLQNGHGLQEYVDANIRSYRSFPSRCDPGGVYTVARGYAPKNDSGVSQGQMNVLAATKGSVNAAFVNMASKLDLCDIRDVATSMGVHNADNSELAHDPSTILGTNTPSPLTMANAYATVAGGGKLCQPIAVDRIITPGGKELPGQAQSCSQVISPEVAAAAAYDLQGPLKTGGTGASANPRDGTPLLGKTGTAEALHSYMVAASSQTSTAVWIGNITGFQNLRRISIGGILASNLRTTVMKPILASLDASSVYGTGRAFPEPVPVLLRGSTIRTPNLAGQSVSAAKRLIEDIGLAFAQGEVVSSAFPAGTVVSSDPVAGSTIARGTTVTATVSDGAGARNGGPPDKHPGGGGHPGKG
ncbi:transglycosylase domain-containing protein [Lacisediminihabitans sp.]|jgi:membrane peptidoglycan carboxypeptidase|uniref:transglycosylase domain-containing protein n=1 Tax=Lacisediminihabitans sp. TaxID=2787631 RepID=UPI002F92CE47